uniref:Cyclin-H1-1 n=1 Tax=Rhizophora mucronata TaxID=61149 RepID=A0A2P2KYX3_RHIMU
MTMNHQHQPPFLSFRKCPAFALPSGWQLCISQSAAED